MSIQEPASRGSRQCHYTQDAAVPLSHTNLRQSVMLKDLLRYSKKSSLQHRHQDPQGTRYSSSIHIRTKLCVHPLNAGPLIHCKE
ncbi:hypothetical protein TGVEG_244015 [Toxoplasma gondii VEG]|uniref:Uncharacterized protein n=3 Tax=Toxoplasma gondii TaxID=5811 RepID=V4ZCK3_TOXGV|nr:hypothetical protein TGVEG_244015 [Toxoplasma gondii VEG]KFG34340.1 hypothetical protein TGP89_244015 [Toxoplasma gondii p89]PUA87319.1 hypothetical protein TGBR9_244015 [Toxoplasma gondii TgCATBr9]